MSSPTWVATRPAPPAARPSAFRPPVLAAGPALVPGFPACPRCAFLAGADPRLCLACAIPPAAERRCARCGQAAEGPCRNRLCGVPTRHLSAVHAPGARSGALAFAVAAYKYRARLGWAVPFARILLGQLEALPPPASPRLLVACPTYVGGQGHGFGHTELVVRVAARLAGALNHVAFDDPAPAVVKLGPTPPSAGRPLPDRRRAAFLLRRVLLVPDPARVAGREVLVYDDLLTSGLTLNEVARALRAAGAADVAGIVLARAPWRGPPGPGDHPAGRVAPT